MLKLLGFGWDDLVWLLGRAHFAWFACPGECQSDLRAVSGVWFHGDRARQIDDVTAHDPEPEPTMTISWHLVG